MTDRLSLVVFWLFVGLIIWFTVRAYLKDLGPIELVRRTADERLRKISISATSSGHPFSGAEAEVLNREEEITTFNRSLITGYRCNYLVRSPSGEYFLVIYRHDAEPYVKHTPHEIARLKLKEIYVPPSSAA